MAVCGRFVSASPPEVVASYFGAELAERLEPSWNVAPTNAVSTVLVDGGVRRLDALRWGLVPSWADDLKVGNRLINARAETVATKNAFRAAFKRRRCIIPADGFYEWTAVPGHRKKQPWFIHRPDGEPYAFAGVWEEWRPRGGGAAGGAGEGEVVRPTTIITGPANEAMSAIHDRMPVVLPPSAWDEWLDPAQQATEAVGRFLVPAPDELVVMHPVGLAVGSPRSRGAELIAPVEPLVPQPAAEGA